MASMSNVLRSVSISGVHRLAARRIVLPWVLGRLRPAGSLLETARVAAPCPPSCSPATATSPPW
ncbi:hypothetical protein C8D87_103437 [Lentzea atacamensis]|uniref:Uncharacterized protein n=1 Tax=Lentzea atacamensis TaxID=531938 RepID=A0ABX9EB19_9PSEU|nr:hypothetical protein [Lentzea atacamensis]RAS67098.1 hypothetical protein C8D87_103437 [Lentzea atacamensis]